MHFGDGQRKSKRALWFGKIVAFLLLGVSIGSSPCLGQTTEKMPISLSASEKALAKKLGFDVRVLEILKAALKPEMGLVETGGWEPDTSFVTQGWITQPLSDADRQGYNKIALDYPELKPLVDQTLATRDWSATNLNKNKLADQPESPELARSRKLSEAMDKYRPLLDEEAKQKTNPLLTWDSVTE